VREEWGGGNKPGPPIQLKSVIASQTHKKIRGRRLRPVLTRTQRQNMLNW